MLKYSRGKLIVFDIEEALSFEGETGPYLQYAVVRANNIFHKLQEREGLTEADVLGDLDATPPTSCSSRGEPTAAITPSGRSCSRRPGSTKSSNRSCGRSNSRRWRNMPSGWRRLFNAFYHRYPILNEEQADRKRWRAAGVAYVRTQLDAGARSDGD